VLDSIRKQYNLKDVENNINERINREVRTLTEKLADKFEVIKKFRLATNDTKQLFELMLNSFQMEHWEMQQIIQVLGLTGQSSKKHPSIGGFLSEVKARRGLLIPELDGVI
jgi:hypothetical protein